jgi:serine/threonine protein kinase
MDSPALEDSSDLRDSLVDYERQAKLGSGTYGVVYKGLHKPTGDIVAIKSVRANQECEGVSQTTLRELAILRSLNHPNTVHLREVIVSDQFCHLILEYMPHDLGKLLLCQEKRSRPLQPDLCRSYAYQILCGVHYLHIHRVLHRDIKPSNLLLNEQGFLKLCDFGLSRMYSLPIRKYTQNVVTMMYRAPEVFLHNDYYELGVDVWSAGCVIAEMVRSEPLFRGADSDMDLAHKVFQALGTPPPDVMQEFADVRAGLIVIPTYPPTDSEELFRTTDTQLIDLCERMLAIDPRRRITAKDALAHPYFDRVSEGIKQLCYPKA